MGRAVLVLSGVTGLTLLAMACQHVQLAKPETSPPRVCVRVAALSPTGGAMLEETGANPRTYLWWAEEVDGGKVVEEDPTLVSEGPADGGSEPAPALSDGGVDPSPADVSFGPELDPRLADIAMPIDPVTHLPVGMFPPAKFSIREGTLPLVQSVELPVLGSGTLLLEPVQGLEGKELALRLEPAGARSEGTLDLETDPPLAWRFPIPASPVTARWLRAGDVLWTELRWGEQCAVRPADLRRLSAELLDNQGYALLRAGNVTGGAAQFQRAQEADPRYARAAYHLACAYALQKKPEEAVAELKRALTLQPRLAHVARQEADLVSLRGRPDYEELVKVRGTEATP
jgi:hypothetical protein